ncbi:hypothetical protein FIBSPDRAFT_850449 [Athelia psychrophila]|uniref:Uncharacterized protein n=1 Tax=Athelia psychrophila TaxID=1759441 RepID=A0A166TFD8_9AGAM|nr:hypothetical protein FIBSPDRAFT_850449 [Fibularhizoctonia sp. CBS 109695]
MKQEKEAGVRDAPDISSTTPTMHHGLANPISARLSGSMVVKGKKEEKVCEGR